MRRHSSTQAAGRKMSVAVPTRTSVSAHVVPVSAKTTWVLLELRLASGLCGWGEITDFGNEAAVIAEVAAIDAAFAAAPPDFAGRSAGAGRRPAGAGGGAAGAKRAGTGFLDAQAQRLDCRWRRCSAAPFGLRCPSTPISTVASGDADAGGLCASGAAGQGRRLSRHQDRAVRRRALAGGGGAGRARAPRHRPRAGGAR